MPARDEATERDVDPIRLFTSDATVYLAGWCRAVEDLRTFRLDRVLAAEVLDGRAFVHPLVRAAVLDAIPAGERAELHRAAAVRLRDRGLRAGAVAPHWHAAEPAGDQRAAADLRASGDFRAHGIYGGSVERVDPDPADEAAVADMQRRLPFDLLYARFDVVRFAGRLAVLELELIEPMLFLDLAPGSAARLADATIARVAAT